MFGHGGRGRRGGYNDGFNTGRGRGRGRSSGFHDAPRDYGEDRQSSAYAQGKRKAHMPGQADCQQQPNRDDRRPAAYVRGMVYPGLRDRGVVVRTEVPPMDEFICTNVTTKFYLYVPADKQLLHWTLQATGLMAPENEDSTPVRMTLHTFSKTPSGVAVSVDRTTGLFTPKEARDITWLFDSLGAMLSELGYFNSRTRYDLLGHKTLISNELAKTVHRLDEYLVAADMPIALPVNSKVMRLLTKNKVVNHAGRVFPRILTSYQPEQDGVNANLFQLTSTKLPRETGKRYGHLLIGGSTAAHLRPELEVEGCKVKLDHLCFLPAAAQEVHRAMHIAAQQALADQEAMEDVLDAMRA